MVKLKYATECSQFSEYRSLNRYKSLYWKIKRLNVNENCCKYELHIIILNLLEKIHQGLLSNKNKNFATLIFILIKVYLFDSFSINNNGLINIVSILGILKITT